MIAGRMSRLSRHGDGTSSCTNNFSSLKSLPCEQKGTPVREGKKEPDDATSPEDTPK